MSEVDFCSAVISKNGEIISYHEIETPSGDGGQWYTLPLFIDLGLEPKRRSQLERKRNRRRKTRWKSRR